MGGEVLLGPNIVPQTLQPQTSTEQPTTDPMRDHPIVWRAPFPEDVSESLVSWENPTGQVTNDDLELAVRVIHHTCMAQ